MKRQKQYTFWDDLFATALFSGHIPFAPGTMGAITATVLWWLGSLVLPHVWLQTVTAALIVVCTVGAIPSVRRLERAWGEDPSRVVIDEVVGVWIPLLAVPTDHNPWYVLAALALFRIFDITKPLGCRKLEDVKGGWGVMLDDVLAGAYALIAMLILQALL